MMNMNDVILKKRNGGKLTQEEIKYFVDGYTKGEIPDYPRPLPGQIVSLTAKIRPVSGFANEGSSDISDYWH